VWEVLEPGDASVFEQTWYSLPVPRDADTLRERWQRIRTLRADVQKQLEVLRVAGKIGSSLAGEVELFADGDEAKFLRSFDDDLRFVFITSQARVCPDGVADAIETALPGVRLAARPSAHRKCERCWHYRSDVGADSEHPEICGRCVSNLFGPGEVRKHA
jgi:isoleucyl-tRNA synthetase